MIKDFFRIILYQPLFNLLVFFAWLVPGHSIGWAIILLTFLVKLILWIPSRKSIEAPLQMREHQPEIKKIQERYKDDRTAQSQALMAFYKEKGINPLSGCLPLLIQLPVIFVLYRVFIDGLNSLRPELIYSFTPHLDSINALFFGIDLTKPDRFVLPLVAAILQYFQARHLQKLNPPTASNSNDPAAIMAKQSQYLFPIMTYFIAFTLPAGLALYWSANALFSVFQQVVVAKSFKPKEPTVQVTVRSKKKKK
jgi:YidC/Oxa1 family membrane protein insertase